jgi:hypothetical protein
MISGYLQDRQELWLTGRSQSSGRWSGVGRTGGPGARISLVAWVDCLPYRTRTAYCTVLVRDVAVYSVSSMLGEVWKVMGVGFEDARAGCVGAT